MCRVPLIELLKSDAILSSLLGGTGRIHPNYSLDASPREGRFLLIRFNASPRRVARVERVTLIAHQAQQGSTDYTPLDQILGRCRFLLESAEHYPGTDGTILTQARSTGVGEDGKDQGYDTLCKEESYQVNWRST